jgi:AraC-like DNA-binding protein
MRKPIKLPLLRFELLMVLLRSFPRVFTVWRVTNKVMLFKTYQPPLPLSRFVDVFWFFSGGGLPHRRERVLPDGSAELVINLDDVPRKRFDRQNPRRFETVRRAWISGPQPEFILIDVLPQATMMGAHFKPGGLAPFVDMPAGELCGKLVELNRIWGAVADELREELLETSGVQPKFQRLEQFLLRRLLRKALPGWGVASAIHAFVSNAGTATVARIAADAGMSHKHFIERFRSVVGLTPKRFSRIRRFQRALGDLQTRREMDWVGLAGECGYYDQAHFIHDFRAFSGITPTGYLDQGGADGRFVPADG